MRVQIVTEDESFEFTPEGAEPTVFVLRRLEKDAVEDVDRQHRKLEFNRRTGAKEWVFSPQAQSARIDDLLDYIIRDWREVGHPITGDAVPCTREMKTKLPGSIKTAIFEQADAGNLTGYGKSNGDAPDPTRR